MRSREVSRYFYYDLPEQSSKWINNFLKLTINNKRFIDFKKEISYLYTKRGPRKFTEYNLNYYNENKKLINFASIFIEEVSKPHATVSFKTGEGDWEQDAETGYHVEYNLDLNKTNIRQIKKEIYEFIMENNGEIIKKNNKINVML